MYTYCKEDNLNDAFSVSTKTLTFGFDFVFVSLKCFDLCSLNDALHFHTCFTPFYGLGHSVGKVKLRPRLLSPFRRFKEDNKLYLLILKANCPSSSSSSVIVTWCVSL